MPISIVKDNTSISTVVINDTTADAEVSLSVGRQSKVLIYLEISKITDIALGGLAVEDEVWRITLNSVNFDYTVLNGDDLADIATGLSSLIDANVNYISRAWDDSGTNKVRIIPTDPGNDYIVAVTPPAGQSLTPATISYDTIVTLSLKNSSVNSERNVNRYYKSYIESAGNLVEESYTIAQSVRSIRFPLSVGQNEESIKIRIVSDDEAIIGVNVDPDNAYVK